jgi:dTDP-4-amino-4,6-dideoxygalactose transaminase
MKIPLFKVFTAGNALQNVQKVLESGYTGQGEWCERFEKEFQSIVSAPVKPLLVNSCTHALDLAYHLTLKRGDTVISTPQTCLATNQPLLHRGINILWADIDPMTGNIDPDSVDYLMGDDVKAIIAVDWAGRSCDYTQLKHYGVPVIQDAAHSLLAIYDQDPVATCGGDFIAWSFQSIKQLSMGDGGALMVPQKFYKEAKLLRWFYLDREASADFRCAQDTAKPGFKYQSNDILASIGVSNIGSIKDMISRARKNARILFDNLQGIPGISMPPFDHGSSHWIFSISCEDREKVQQNLTQAGIGCSEVHRRNDEHTAFKEFKRTLPGVDYFADHQLNIPCGWWVTEDDLNYIIDTIKKIK